MPLEKQKQKMPETVDKHKSKRKMLNLILFKTVNVLS